jgi:hypothetical protein
MNNLVYPITNKKPLVIESYRPIKYNLITYKRRLRISRFNAFMLDEVLGTFIALQRTQFVVLDLQDIEKACIVLGIEYKPVNTYFCIDPTICSFNW